MDMSRARIDGKLRNRLRPMVSTPFANVLSGPGPLGSRPWLKLDSPSKGFNLTQRRRGRCRSFTAGAGEGASAGSSVSTAGGVLNSWLEGFSGMDGAEAIVGEMP